MRILPGRHSNLLLKVFDAFSAEKSSLSAISASCPARRLSAFTNGFHLQSVRVTSYDGHDIWKFGSLIARREAMMQRELRASLVPLLALLLTSCEDAKTYTLYRNSAG